MTTLSVVIPAYNEENGIAEIVNRVLAVAKELPAVGVDQLELIVVNDGSKDKTAEITRNIAQNASNLRLISHSTNHGYGAALKTGFDSAEGELIGFLDADGTYPPEYFPKLCKEALAGAQVVVGSRRGGAESHMPPMRKLGNFIWSNLLTALGTQRIQDPASGMRVFHRNILNQIYPLPDGLNLTPVMSTRAVHEHLKYVETPIPYSERLGDSKLSVIHDGTLFLKSIVWTALTYNPVRILGMFGTLGILLAIIAAVTLVFSRAGGSTELTTGQIAMLFGGAVSGFVGVTLFVLGVLFNYLVALFHRDTIRQGLFGKPIFSKPLESYFGSLGALLFVIGIGIAVFALTAVDSALDTNRLWLYLLGSMMTMILGVQLFTSWIIITLLADLRERGIE